MFQVEQKKNEDKLRLGLSVIMSRCKPNSVTLKYTERSTRSLIGRQVPYYYFTNYGVLKFKVTHTIL
jgi:acyl CoA:acetate/3-ketoacid CoA transferase beta subunit